jgi:hypothetical protein
MKNGKMRWAVVMVLALMPASAALGQGGDQVRAITLASFAEKRPAEGGGGGARKEAAGAVAGTKNGRTYVRVETGSSKKGGQGLGRQKLFSAKAAPRPAATPSADPMLTPSAEPAGPATDIGVTIWKLRPVRDGDAGHTLPVKVGDKYEAWTPERVGPSTVFKKDDRVRFAVESSESGYLYIFDSETLAGGRTGEPCMIFPEELTDDNSVGPGSPVEFPDQSEPAAYFKIDPQDPNYRGETLTVILSPTRLTGLKVKDVGGCPRLDTSQKAMLEAGEFEVFTRQDSDDAVYSDAEASAVCGVKTRQLTREKPDEKPCEKTTRKLTREQPLPQSLYRVRPAPGKPAVVEVKLDVPVP